MQLDLFFAELEECCIINVVLTFTGGNLEIAC